MWKTLILLVLLAAAGFAGGYAWTRIELGPIDTSPARLTSDAQLAAERSQLPKLEVLDGTTFDFGSMEYGSWKQHAFVVKNAGQTPLTIKVLSTSCSCIVPELPNGQLKPGEQTKVELKWEAKRHGPFTQSAKLETNDPLHPTLDLTVTGRVVGTYLVEPSDITFTQLTAGEPASAEFRVYCFVQDQLASPESVQWTNPENRDQFAVKFEPLTAAELAQRDDHPKSGYKGIIAVKTGEQLGDFRQTLNFILPTAERPLVTLDLRGTVEGRASILGDERWDADHLIWSLGEWKRGTAKQESGLTVVLMGDQREALKPRVVSHTPEWIDVEFGSPIFLAERNQTHLPLTIKIPETAQSGSYTGLSNQRMGRVMFDTGIENHPKLKFSLRFTID